MRLEMLLYTANVSTALMIPFARLNGTRIGRIIAMTASIGTPR